MPFSKEITGPESEFGFILAYVSNPRSQYYGQPSIIEAAIKPVQRSYRMMKLDVPGGGNTYPMYCFCCYGNSVGDADWKPVISGLSSPEMTLASLKLGEELTLHARDRFSPATLP